MEKKGKGFTLVELLAVIVILAVVMIIAIPQITNVIRQTRVNAMASTTKLIASKAEEKEVENDALQVNETITCEELVKLDDNYDVSTCTIVKNAQDKWEVSISGAAGKKFEGITCIGTKDSVTCTRDESNNNNNNSSGGVSYTNVINDTCIVNATNGASELFELASAGTYSDMYIDNNCDLRYGGADGTSYKPASNYVLFNDEVWRIIGVLKTKKTPTSADEYRIKLIREIPITKLSFGTTNSWADSTVKAFLNDDYANGVDWEGTSLDSTSQSLIDDAVWYLGAVDVDSTTVQVYNQERNGSTWTGKVGIVNPSDYGYSWKYELCAETTNLTSLYLSACYGYPYGSYLHYTVFHDGWNTYGGSFWTMNPGTFSPTTSMSIIYSGTDMFDSGACEGYYCDYTDNLGVNPQYGVVPVVYLKANVKITGGTGEAGDEYTLGL